VIIDAIIEREDDTKEVDIKNKAEEKGAVGVGAKEATIKSSRNSVKSRIQASIRRWKI